MKMIKISLIVCIIGLLTTVSFTDSARAQLNQPLTVTLGNGYQKFSANGTFTVPAGVYYVTARVFGGGGGSNGGATGGGAGAFAFVTNIAVTPAANITVTVGVGGALGVDGGISSFGTSLSVNGGQGSTSGSHGGTIAGLSNGLGMNIGSNFFVAGFDNNLGTGGVTGVASFPGFQVGHIGEGGTGGVHNAGYDGQVELYW